MVKSRSSNCSCQDLLALHSFILRMMARCSLPRIYHLQKLMIFEEKQFDLFDIYIKPWKITVICFALVMVSPTKNLAKRRKLSDWILEYRIITTTRRVAHSMNGRTAPRRKGWGQTMEEDISTIITHSSTENHIDLVVVNYYHCY